MKYKAKDIAKEVGVSAAAVSLVLNNKPGVGKKKRKEIIDKIIELKCEYLLEDANIDPPNSADDIGFIIYKRIGNIIDEFPMFNYMSESIAKELEKYDCKMNIMYVDKSDLMAEQSGVFESLHCKGYIVYGVEMYAEDAKLFRRLDVPYVFLDNPFYDIDVDTVSVDNFWGIQQTFKYLYEMGHREIGYIKSKSEIQCFDERYEAYCKLMNENGLEVKPEYIMPVSYTEKETDADVKEYLDTHEKLPTAFMSDNDLLGCRVLRFFKQNGIQVPEDVSFVGFDNRPICSFVEPGMTTVKLPSDDMSIIAVNILMNRIERGKGPGIKCRVTPKIIKRDSVKKLM